MFYDCIYERYNIVQYFFLILYMLSFADTQHDIYSEQKYLLGGRDIGTGVKTIRGTRKKENHGGNDHQS